MAKKSVVRVTRIQTAMARPSSYTPELGEQICRQIAETTDGLRKVCEDAGTTPVTLFHWLNSFPEFLQQYTRAKEIQAELLADEMQSICDEQPMVFIPSKAGGYEAIDRAGIDRNRLRVDTRKWIASKLLPKRYGDLVRLTGADAGPIAFQLERIDE